MTRASISRLPFSGAGGLMMSSALLIVLIAELAAIGVGEGGGQLAVDEDGVRLLVVGATRHRAGRSERSGARTSR
jgi:hypothetical protein